MAKQNLRVEFVMIKTGNLSLTSFVWAKIHLR